MDDDPRLTYVFALDTLDADNATFKAGDEATLVISRNHWDHLNKTSHLNGDMTIWRTSR